MGVDGADRIFTVAARSGSLRSARAAAQLWLRTVGWPQAAADDIVYAVNEAVTNAVEHAYGGVAPVGTVELSLRVVYDLDGGRRVHAEVRDRGRWRPPAREARGRGRGLMLMRALMDEVTVRHGTDPRGGGTVVEMLSPPVR